MMHAEWPRRPVREMSHPRVSTTGGGTSTTAGYVHDPRRGHWTMASDATVAVAHPPADPRPAPPRSSGKSSIQRVVFRKMSPNETLFLESTSRISKIDVASLVDYEVWDFPGHFDPFDPALDAEGTYRRLSVLVFVIDAQV